MRCLFHLQSPAYGPRSHRGTIPLGLKRKRNETLFLRNVVPMFCLNSSLESFNFLIRVLRLNPRQTSPAATANRNVLTDKTPIRVDVTVIHLSQEDCSFNPAVTKNSEATGIDISHRLF